MTNQSIVAEEDEITVSSPKSISKKKKKRFKRLRGLLTLPSHNKAQKSGGMEQAPPHHHGTDALPPTIDDDEEASTVYGAVDVEDYSVANTSTKSASVSTSARTTTTTTPGGTLKTKKKKSKHSSKFVLLIMDLQTRRFELLQLECNTRSNKADIADILEQIPVSVTEASLRQQSYRGIASSGINKTYRSSTSEEQDDDEDLLLPPNRALSSFRNDILVAIPAGADAKECVRLAKPILSDDKVQTMLTYSGIDLSKAWNQGEDSSITTVPRSSMSPPTSRQLHQQDNFTCLIKVVVLLFDSDTTRFELLRLNFDSVQAVVADVIARLPVSVISGNKPQDDNDDDLLLLQHRRQTYSRIADTDGMELDTAAPLVSFCHRADDVYDTNNNNVLIALPPNVNAKDWCARLARLMLSDSKMVDSLARSGIDVKGWKTLGREALIFLLDPLEVFGLGSVGELGLLERSDNTAVGGFGRITFGQRITL